MLKLPYIILHDPTISVYEAQDPVQEFPTSEPKSQLIDQQCVVYNSSLTSVMLVILDTPVAICSQALMDIEARPRQCANIVIINNRQNSG